MNKNLMIIFVILICIFSVYPEDPRGFKGVKIKDFQGNEITEYSQSHALVIGVSDYNNGWPKLPGVKKDITAVNEYLAKNGFLVTVIEDPDSNELHKAFSDFINNYGFQENARLLFYFAGHGYTVQKSYGKEMGYIVPADAPDPNKDLNGFKEKALDMQMMEVYARRIEANHAIFLFDSCFSGSLFVTRAAGEVTEYIDYITGQPVRQFITSGSADEQVPDDSIFCRLFIDALKGGGDLNKDGYVTGSELGLYLLENVTNYSKSMQHPQYGKIRDPELDKGDFVFNVSPGDFPIVNPDPPGREEDKRFFSVSLFCAYSAPLFNTLSETLSPCIYTDLFASFMAFDPGALRLLILAGGNFLYHPKAAGFSYTNNLLETSILGGIGIEFPLVFFEPLSISLNLLGGLGFSFLESGLYDDNFNSRDPVVAGQLELKYSLRDVLFLNVKGSYLAVMYKGESNLWLNEVSVGAGIGIRI